MQGSVDISLTCLSTADSSGVGTGMPYGSEGMRLNDVATTSDGQTPRESLKRRSIRAGVWSVAGFGATSLVRLASNLVLVRYLAPEAFGLMAVAVSLSAWLGMMTDLGINASVMREKEGERQDFLNVAWTIQFLRNLLIAFALAAAAVAVGVAGDVGWLPEKSVYRDPSFPPLVLFVAF